jgi:hypothetical protein
MVDGANIRKIYLIYYNKNFVNATVYPSPAQQLKKINFCSFLKNKKRRV